MRFDSNTGASQSVYRQNDALDLIYYNAGLNDVSHNKFRCIFFITARLSMVARMPPRLHEDELLVAGDGEQGVGRHVGDDPPGCTPAS